MPSIRSSRVVIDGELRPATITFEDGVITGIDATAAPDEDYGDLVMMPGLVDSHVHVNEPGRTDWEGFASATRAAAAGGTTTIVDMPLNSVPPTTSVGGLVEKREAARGKLSVDVAFWGGVIPGSLSQLPPLIAEGVCGFKAFLVDSGVPEFPAVTGEILAEALAGMATGGIPALVHAEHAPSLQPPVGDPRSYRTYLESRPVQSEVTAVAEMAGLADDIGKLIHILHVSSGEAVDLIAGSGDMSGETCPHYLTFAAEDIPEGATLFKCAPPIREKEQREALWDGLRHGGLSMVVSDHSPAPPLLKAPSDGDFITAWGGISSLQLRLPATWSGASQRSIGLPEITDWLATAPARLAGLDDRKGSIAVGLDADLVVWDPDQATTVRGRDLEHRHPITPYEGMTLRGRVVTTILGGREVFARGRFTEGHGRMLRR